MRLLLFNLATDAADPVLGFTSQWINALARRVEKIWVITMRAGEVEVAPNVTVYSLGKELGYSEPRRAANFYLYLRRILHHDVQVCFSHMTPLFTAMGAPVLKPRGIPIVTWYAHRQVTPMLKLAHRCSERMLASAPGAYRYKHDKLTVLGQGIDTGLFTPGDAARGEACLLSVGRIAPIKNLETLLGAVSLLRQKGHAVRCKFIGEPAPHDPAYAHLLKATVAALNLENAIDFVGPVRHAQLPEYYRQALAHVNLCPSGALDKAVLEAMSCACPSLVANSSFRGLLNGWENHLFFEYGSAVSLASQLENFLRMPRDQRRSMGEDLRHAVLVNHGLERLADALLNCFHQVCAA